MRPTIDPSTALGLPRRSWWRSGSSSMRSSSIASRSAGETGVANGSTPASSASSCRSARAQALEGRDRGLLGGGAAEPLLDPLAQRVGGRREHEDALGGDGVARALGQPGEALDERGRLARAGAPDDEQRSAGVLDGLVLGGGEHLAT